MKTKQGQEAIMINVEYNEVKPSTYKGISVMCKRTKKTFYTKNPSFDFCCACVYIGASQKFHKMGGIILFGSSVDHFEMDGGVIETQPSDTDLLVAKDWMAVKNLLPSKKTKVK